MNLLDLPSSKLATRAQVIRAPLTGQVDVLDYSVVAMKRTGGGAESILASIARSRHKLEEAARLVQARYAWRGYSTTASSAHAVYNDRCTVTLIAETGSATVGTVTIGLDGPRGLLTDETYSERVSAVRSQGRRVCELGRLALIERADTRTVLSTLFSLAYGVAKALQDVTDVFIEVNPRHVKFYRRVFGFVIDEGERFCKRVQAPAVLLHTSVEELETRLRAYCI